MRQRERAVPVLRSASMRLSGQAALVALATAIGPACASTPDGGSDRASVDGSMGSHDSAGSSPDAPVPGIDAGADAPLGGKSCAVLPDGTLCGPSPDICHDAPVCEQGACAAAAAKTDGFVCAPAPDACHDSGTCAAGKCGAPVAKSDGTNWSSGDATAICCSGKEVHASTDTDCGACGIACNASNGESCQILGGHYFCRGCVSSALCWSHCCSESFTPYTCSASDCAGTCSSMYCPAGTHCVSGGTTSSDYCSY